MTKNPIPWTRFGFESILIVSSILVALTVDSWWEYRNKREDEQQVLASLLIEFERNKIELDRALKSFTNSNRAAKRLLEFTGKSLSDEDEDVIGQNVNGLYSYFTFDPSSGALDSLISAGQLDLILNIELRARLAAWSGLVRDYKEEETEVDYLAYRELERLLRPIVPLPNVEDASPGLFQSQWKETYSDLRFLNLVGNLSYWTYQTIDEASFIGSEIDQIIALIEAELEH